jgi:hypothetical protein
MEPTKLKPIDVLTPSGTVVLLVEDNGSLTRTATRSGLWKLGHGDLVVMVEGRTGGYLASRIFVEPRADGHVAHVCTRGHDGPGCMFCDGGLFLCDTCGSFEGATTSECPGRLLTAEESKRIYAGQLDFKGGAWVNAPSGSCSSHYDLMNKEGA